MYHKLILTLASTALIFVLCCKFVEPARHFKRTDGNHKHNSWEEDVIRDVEEWTSETGDKGKLSRELLEVEDSVTRFPANDSFGQSLAGARVIVVDQTGRGQFHSVQAAVNAVADNNRFQVVIQINAGIYKEKVFIPYSKPYIKFQGAGRELSVIQSSGNAMTSGGTADSATVYVNADNFVAVNVGFRNAAPAPSSGAQDQQAVALLLNGDKHAFYQCGIYGAQDTLFDYVGRHYFKECFIQGSIDFIFGNGQSLFVGCQLNSIAKLTGSLTAQKRSSPQEKTGFIFVNCKVTGTGPVYLGRAWGAYSRVVYIYTYMENIIIPEGWFDWSVSSRQRTVYYGQYQCTGPGANEAGRVKWSHELSSKDAAALGQISFIDGNDWLQ